MAYKQIDQEALKTVKAANKDLYTAYAGALSSDVEMIARTFKKEVDKEIERIENDELYDTRQKGVMIEKMIEEKRGMALQLIEREKAEQEVMIEGTKDFVLDELDKLERKASRSFQKREYELNDVLNQTRTALAMANNQARIEEIAEQLFKQGERDPIKARVLMNNAYLFMDRANQLGMDQAASARLQNHLKVLLDKSESLVYDDHLLTVKAMLHNLNNARIGNQGSERIVNKTVETVKKRAADLKRKFESARSGEIFDEVRKRTTNQELFKR